MEKKGLEVGRMVYEVMGADIAETTKKAIPVPSRDMIGGFGIAAKMFSVIADIEDSKDPRKSEAMGEKVDQANELANEIIKACGPIFDGKSLNAVTAGLAEAVVKMVIARDKKEVKSLKDMIGDFLGKLGGAKVVDLSNGDEEPEHECHAECPIVGICPKGRRLFGEDNKAKTTEKAKAEAATTTSKINLEKKDDSFEALKKAIETGDSVTAMNLMSKLMTK